MLLAIQSDDRPWTNQVKLSPVLSKLFALLATSYQATFHTRMQLCPKFGLGNKTPQTLLLQRGELFMAMKIDGSSVSLLPTPFSILRFVVVVNVSISFAAFRTRLAFFAGAMNSPTRQELVRVWGKDAEIFAHSGRLKTPYADELLRSKFCLHVKGFEVNTARVGDSIFYGCVPVIISNYYDLPFGDILNWKSFSVVVATSDIPSLKKILKGISDEEYAMLQSNVLKVRKHFKWHSSPVDFDTFHMVMYQLWLRRTSVRLRLMD